MTAPDWGFSPTAVQLDVEEHEPADRLGIPFGTRCFIQVIPPSVVEMMAYRPTAAHLDVDPHEIPARLSTPLGTV
jgi:hypothetical protein